MIIALDYGDKRTGVAISDDGEQIAFRHKALKLRPNEEMFEVIISLLQRLQPKEVIVGEPLGLDDKETQMSKKIRTVGEKIAHISNLPVKYWNEIMSSSIARQQKVTKDIDSESARIILQEYLDYKNGEAKVI